MTASPVGPDTGLAPAPTLSAHMPVSPVRAPSPTPARGVQPCAGVEALERLYGYYCPVE